MDAYHGVRLRRDGRDADALLQGEQENVARPADRPAVRSAQPRPAARDCAACSPTCARAASPPASTSCAARRTTSSPTCSRQASSKGQRVASYLTLAWFDRHLRGRATAPSALRAERFDAQRRRLVDRDRHARPGRAGTSRTRSRASAWPTTCRFYYPSDLFDGGQLCLDLRVRRCPTPRRRPSGRGARVPRPASCVSRRGVHDPPARPRPRVGARDRRRPTASASAASRGRLIARIDLRGAPRRRVSVRIVARTRAGRVVREVRRYRTCAR